MTWSSGKAEHMAATLSLREATVAILLYLGSLRQAVAAAERVRSARMELPAAAAAHGETTMVQWTEHTQRTPKPVFPVAPAARVSEAARARTHQKPGTATAVAAAVREVSAATQSTTPSLERTRILVLPGLADLALHAPSTARATTAEEERAAPTAVHGRKAALAAAATADLAIKTQKVAGAMTASHIPAVAAVAAVD